MLQVKYLTFPGLSWILYAFFRPHNFDRFCEGFFVPCRCRWTYAFYMHRVAQCCILRGAQASPKQQQCGPSRSSCASSRGSRKCMWGLGDAGQRRPSLHFDQSSQVAGCGPLASRCDRRPPYTSRSTIFRYGRAGSGAAQVLSPPSRGGFHYHPIHPPWSLTTESALTNITTRFSLADPTSSV